MATIPKKVSDRLIRETARFRKILASAKDRDVNESDTVTIVSDMLEAVFGYDKYSEVTREFAIQGTYCDLAVKSEGKVEYLIEVKAIGLELRDNHMRQAVNYAANKGIEWVVLTNGIVWDVYRVTLDQKVVHEKVCSIDMLNANPRRKADLEMLYILCKRGVKQNLLQDMYEYKKSVNRFMLGALMMSPPVITSLRRELRKIKPGLKVSDDDILEIVKEEVIKRDIVECETTTDLAKKIKRSQSRRKSTKAKTES